MLVKNGLTCLKTWILIFFIINSDRKNKLMLWYLFITIAVWFSVWSIRNQEPNNKKMLEVKNYIIIVRLAADIPVTLLPKYVGKKYC